MKNIKSWRYNVRDNGSIKARLYSRNSGFQSRCSDYVEELERFNKKKSPIQYS